MQLALLCSIDTLLASAGIGLLGSSDISRCRLVLAFAMSDLTATLVGASLHSGLAPLYRGATAPFAVGTLLYLVAVGILAYTRKFPALLFSVPILLSVDNFVAWLLEGSAHAAQFALLAGVASGLSAWMGSSIAQFAAPILSQSRSIVTGFSLVALAFMLLN